MQYTTCMALNLNRMQSQPIWVRERERKGSNMLTSVTNGLHNLFNLGNTSIYSPLFKTSRYGPIAPFSAHTWTVCNSSPHRLHKNPNGYKNVKVLKNDLWMVCPSRPDSPWYIKPSQTEVLLNLHVCLNLYYSRSAPGPRTVRNTKYLYWGRFALRPRTVRSSKMKTKTELPEFCPNTSPSTMDDLPPGTRRSTVQKLCKT
jgi:hypothetical protein